MGEVVYTSRVHYGHGRHGGTVPDEKSIEQRADVDLAEKVFTNSPLCLTVTGLIKIYTRFERITNLANNFLVFVCLGYFVATGAPYFSVAKHRPCEKIEARACGGRSLLAFALLHRRRGCVHDVHSRSWIGWVIRAGNWSSA